MNSHLMNNTEELSFLYPFVSIKRQVELLDVGCGNCILSSNIYNKFFPNIKKIIAIDKDESEDAGLVCDNLVYHHNSCISNKPMQEGSGCFREIDAISYFNKYKDQFDIILFSNILHFFDYKRAFKMVKSALSLLKSDGFIYIKVANENHHYNRMPDRYTYNRELISNLRGMGSVCILRRTYNFYEIILKNH